MTTAALNNLSAITKQIFSHFNLSLFHSRAKLNNHQQHQHDHQHQLLINEYVEVHRIDCFLLVSYRGIELGIENGGISLVLVSTTKCLVS